MGLRPSVKSDDNSSKMSSNSTNNNETATSTNSENNSSTTSPPQRQAWTVRGQLLLNFHDAISRAINSPEMIQKCNDIAKDMSRNDENDSDTKTNTSIASQSYHHQQQHNTKSIAKEYEAEAALIVENKTQRDNIVRNKSIAVGLFAFITLRSGRGISSLVRKAIANRSSVYKFDNIPSSSSASSSISHTAAQTTTTIAIKQPSTIRKFINLSIDISISTTLTLLSGTYIFIPRPSSYIEDMSQLPLVQGKSVYAEMVCPPLLKEYRKVMEQFGGRWPVSMSSSSTTTSSNKDIKKKNENGIELTQEDVSLNIIRKFVENCSKRSKYERALLEERNAFNNEQEGSSAVSRMMRRITGREDTNNTTGKVAHNVQSEEEGVEDKHKKIQRRKTRLGTVSIPSPGVPEDVAVDVDLDVFDLVEDEEE